MVASERREAARRYTKSQAELSALSALEFAVHRMQGVRTPWRTKEIEHQAIVPSVSYTLVAEQHGAFSLLKANGFSTLGDDTLSKMLQARAGYRIKGLPALTLLDPNASVALAGQAVLHGEVALQRGKVERSSHYKMPAGPSAQFTGELLDEAWPLWDSIAFFSGETSAWLEENLRSGSKKCVWDARDTIRGKQICRTATLRGDAFCDSCCLFADSIRITGNASLRQALLGARSLQMEGKGQADGQFLAMDSLAVDLETKQGGVAVFLVNGRKKGPAEYAGSLAMQRYTGKALVLFQGENWDASLPGVPVVIGDKVSMQGLVLAHGTLDLKGKVLGSVLAWNLAFEEGGTLWQGYLKDAALRQDTTMATLVPDSWFLGGKAAYEMH